jgi:hypothetical protein
MHSECVKREGTRLSPCQTFNQAHARSTQRGVEVLIVDLHDADAHIIIMIYTLQRSLRPRKIRACTMYSCCLACYLQDGTLWVQGDPHVSVKTAHRLYNPSRPCPKIWVSSTTIDISVPCVENLLSFSFGFENAVTFHGQASSRRHDVAWHTAKVWSSFPLLGNYRCS